MMRANNPVQIQLTVVQEKIHSIGKCTHTRTYSFDMLHLRTPFAGKQPFFQKPKCCLEIVGRCAIVTFCTLHGCAPFCKSKNCLIVQSSSLLSQHLPSVVLRYYLSVRLRLHVWGLFRSAITLSNFMHWPDLAQQTAGSAEARRPSK